MSKQTIQPYQIRVYMNARDLGLTQADAASIAEFSERSGQRIEAGAHQPNRGRVRAGLADQCRPLSGRVGRRARTDAATRTSIAADDVVRAFARALSGAVSASAADGATAGEDVESAVRGSPRGDVRVAPWSNLAS